MKQTVFSSGIDTPEAYQKRLENFKSMHHSQCVFNKKSPVSSLRFRFKDGGVLSGEFTCSEEHQGYDRMVHGGILAAIVDASMAQCLMGHDVVAYTTDLNLKYRNAILINQLVFLETSIEKVNIWQTLHNAMRSGSE